MGRIGEIVSDVVTQHHIANVFRRIASRCRRRFGVSVSGNGSLLTIRLMHAAARYEAPSSLHTVLSELIA